MFAILQMKIMLGIYLSFGRFNADDHVFIFFYFYFFVVVVYFASFSYVDLELDIA